MSPLAPEQRAWVDIDTALTGAGWVVQGRKDVNLSASKGVAVREFKLASGHGFADYLLFVDGKAVEVLEAKPAGHTLSGVEPQAEKYATGLPAGLNPPVEPLPFLYISTGAVTKFTNLLDPDPKSRKVFRIARPEAMAGGLSAETPDTWVKGLLSRAGWSTRTPSMSPPPPCSNASGPSGRRPPLTGPPVGGGAERRGAHDVPTPE